jgi:aspartate aminotransferase
MDMEKKGIEIVDFGSGDPSFFTPKKIIDSATRAMKNGFTHYVSASGIEDLKEAVQEKLKRDNDLSYDKNQIIITHGTKGAIYNILQVICEEGDEVIIPAPYYLSYPEQVKLSGAKPVIISALEKEKFRISPSLLKKVITNKTKAIIFNNPCNPTGVVYARKELEKIANIILEKRIYVISDEIYEKIIYDGREHISFAFLGDEISKLTFTVNGFSKSYAMTGWRVGYAAGVREVISVMGRLQSQSISCLSPFSQKACVNALRSSQGVVKKMVEEYTRRRNYMVDRLQKMGISCLKPEGAFYVFPNVSIYFGKKIVNKVIKNSRDFAQILLEEAKVALVCGTAYGASDNVRLTYAPSSMEMIKKGMDRIERFLCRLK